MAKVIVDLSVSLDGFIADPNNSTEQTLGKGGMRLFAWYFDGDTPIRHYEAVSSPGVPVTPFELFRSSAEVFDELVENSGSVVTGRRTYDIADTWAGNGPAPGLPLFMVTHHSKITFRLGAENIQLDALRVVHSPGVTHLRFRVVK